MIVWESNELYKYHWSFPECWLFSDKSLALLLKLKLCIELSNCILKLDFLSLEMSVVLASSTRVGSSSYDSLFFFFPSPIFRICSTCSSSMGSITFIYKLSSDSNSEMFLTSGSILLKDYETTLLFFSLMVFAKMKMSKTGSIALWLVIFSFILFLISLKISSWLICRQSILS